MAKPAAKPKTEAVKAAPAAQDTLPGQDTPPAAQDTLPGQDTPVATPTKPDAKKLVEVPVLQVVGPAQGRWRIGRHFTAEVTVLVAADLTEEQIAALHADPALTVIDAQASGVSDA